MAFPRYKSYRDSGCDWLGEIPSEWKLQRLGTIFEERTEKVSDKDFPPLSVTKNGVLPQLDSAAKSDDGDNRKGVREGDFVINSRSDRKGSSGIAKKDGSVSLINIVLKPKGVNPRYTEHLLKSNGFIEEFYRNGHGIVADLWTTRYWDMKSIPIPLPDLLTQQRIANFLDQKTAEIDEAIVKKQRLIELLKEQKAILINRAVTKGLNPDVPMRDSGVEWIGEVPAHWGVKKLKYVAGEFMYGTSVDCNTESSGIPVLRIPNISKGYLSLEDLKYAKLSKQEEENYLLKDNDILIVRTNGNPQLVGRCALIGGTGRFMFASYLIKVTPQKNVVPQFLATVMASASIQDYLTHSARTSAGNYNLNTQSLGDAYLAYPPIEEQKQILAYEQSLQLNFTAILDAAEKEICLLVELKSCIIAHAVTGKIKISDYI